MGYEEILRRTLPQLNAILAKLPAHIRIKNVGISSLFGGYSEESKPESNNENESESNLSSQEEIDSFFA